MDKKIAATGFLIGLSVICIVGGILYCLLSKDNTLVPSYFGTAVCREVRTSLHCLKGCLTSTDYFLIDSKGNMKEISRDEYNKSNLPVCDGVSK